MAEKFSLHFDLLTRDQIEASVTGNPFVEKNRLILRLDMAARSDELKMKLARIICRLRSSASSGCTSASVVAAKPGRDK